MAAAAIKALNAKIRSNPVSDYFCSTHFWGPASNFGIPLAAIADAQKDPEIISGRFTGVLVVYSATFMRYALAVTPKNYLLFACHFTNFGSQLVQGYRWYDYHYLAGKSKWEAIREQAKQTAGNLEEGAKDTMKQAEGVAQKGVDKVT